MNPELTEELSAEALGSKTVLINVVEQAARRNGWRVLASIEAPPASGMVQHGVMAAEREARPFVPADQNYLTVGWARQGDGSILFHQGDYDLTRESAIHLMIERSGK